MSERQELLNEYAATSRAFADAVERLSHLPADGEAFIRALADACMAHRTCERSRIKLDKHLRAATREIEAWEGEGGAASAPLGAPMCGTPSQVEWAQRIKCEVNTEFDRVAASFRSVAANQSGDKRADTEAIIGILEDKRAEVMRRNEAGYFIHDWQQIDDQVRQMIVRDSHYQAIKSNRTARRRF